jgi:hypothetical protein
MTEMEKMWVELAEHQPIADKLGYGTQWQCMCGLKTAEAARAAYAAAAAAGASGTWSAGSGAWGALKALNRIIDANREKPYEELP